MDRNKVSHGSPAGEEDERARKRGRPTPKSYRISPTTVFEAVWNYRERNRNIREHFEELPSKERYPDYYVKITTPISLKEIKAKLDDGRYKSVDKIKNDLFLMFDNAAQYNKRSSQIYSDSQRLRHAVNTLLDSEISNNSKHKRERDVQPTPSRSLTRGTKSGQAVLNSTMLNIIDEMLSLTNESGELLSHCFKLLPNKRQWPDYYRLIARPISLNQIRNKANDGKFQNWAEFENEVLLIRKNAEEYNAEGSNIVIEARTLEKYFVERLAEERNRIGDGTGSGIKLRFNMSSQKAQSPEQAPVMPKIKLNVGNKQVTAAATVQPTLIDPDGMDIDSPPKTPPKTTTPALQSSTVAVRPHPRSRTASARPGTPANEGQPKSDLDNAIPSQQTARASSIKRVLSSTPRPEHGKTNGTAGPPESIVVRPRSETPLSQQPMAPPSVHGMSLTPGLPNIPPTAPQPPRSAPMIPAAVLEGYGEPIYRPQQHINNPLMPSVHISSNSLYEPRFVMNTEITPDDGFATQTRYLHIPSEFQMLSIRPTLSTRLTSRPYNINCMHWVTGGIDAHPQRHIQRNPHMGTPNNPCYDVQIIPPTNTITVTVVIPSDRPGASGVDEWEMERFCIYIVPVS